MCSRKWLMPFSDGLSKRDPTRICASSTERCMCGMGTAARRRPFDSVVRIDFSSVSCNGDYSGGEEEERDATGSLEAGKISRWGLMGPVRANAAPVPLLGFPTACELGLRVVLGVRLRIEEALVDLDFGLFGLLQAG